MAELEFTIEMRAPVDRVAAFFVPQRMPYWYGAEMDAAFEVQGGAAEFAAGQKVRITGRLAGRELSLTVVVTRSESGRALAWQFKDAYGVRGRQQWELAPSAEGTCVVMRDSYELPGRLGKLVDALWTRRNVARRDRMYLEKLRQLAERR